MSLLERLPSRLTSHGYYERIPCMLSVCSIPSFRDRKEDLNLRKERIAKHTHQGGLPCDTNTVFFLASKEILFPLMSFSNVF